MLLASTFTLLFLSLLPQSTKAQVVDSPSHDHDRYQPEPPAAGQQPHEARHHHQELALFHNYEIPTWVNQDYELLLLEEAQGEGERDCSEICFGLAPSPSHGQPLQDDDEAAVKLTSCKAYTYLPSSLTSFPVRKAQCRLYSSSSLSSGKALVASLSPALEQGTKTVILEGCKSLDGIMGLDKNLPPCTPHLVLSPSSLFTTQQQQREREIEKRSPNSNSNSKKSKRPQLSLSPCPSHLRACRIPGFGFGFECIELNELNSCGGCTSETEPGMEAKFDCERREGVEIAACVEERCRALRCKEGWRVGLFGRCVRV
ncbi:hypothetical protein T439DRAFT_325603 [Meredithblackwellia eburnea MCA 4105]